MSRMRRSKTAGCTAPETSERPGIEDAHRPMSLPGHSLRRAPRSRTARCRPAVTQFATTPSTGALGVLREQLHEPLRRGFARVAHARDEHDPVDRVEQRHDVAHLAAARERRQHVVEVGRERRSSSRIAGWASAPAGWSPARRPRAGTASPRATRRRLRHPSGAAPARVRPEARTGSTRCIACSTRSVPMQHVGEPVRTVETEQPRHAPAGGSSPPRPPRARRRRAGRARAPRRASTCRRRRRG